MAFRNSKLMSIYKEPISELRRDLVTQDWVVIATGRAKRPHDFAAQKKPRFRQPKKDCPFEYLHKEAVLAYAMDGGTKPSQWWAQVIPNKYPAFAKGTCAAFEAEGPYEKTQGVGFHEVVITRDHTRAIAEMSDQEVELIIRAYQERYLKMKKDECVQYVSIFHNQGRLAGASISHPHSQIIATPVVPPDVWRSIHGSKKYYEKYKTCVHCVMIRHEMQEGVRLIHENEGFISFAPYASRTAFEMRVFPKEHRARFEDIGLHDRMLLSQALRISMGKIAHGVNDPDLNFFLHTAPVKNGHTYYHWHFEIVPKTAIWAGFEIGTGIEISTIAPEDAAGFLRKIKV